MINFLQWLTEEKEHHVTAVPLVGFSPHSHDGHAKDLGQAVHDTPGKHKVIGMSAKADHFSPDERRSIFKKQLDHHGFKGISIKSSSSAGETLRHAKEKIGNKAGKHVLHLVVGADREKWGHSLAGAIKDGKIEGAHFHEVHVHTPADSGRSHGLSGTKMRQHAHDNDLNGYHKHLGPAFSKSQAQKIMNKTREGIENKTIKLKR